MIANFNENMQMQTVCTAKIKGNMETIYRYVRYNRNWRMTTKVFKKNKSPLVDYIFVDVQRLESYMFQIEGGIKYERVPTWSAGLSPGPSAGISIQKISREWTYHEMITRLLTHLKDTKQLDTDRKHAVFDLDKQVLFCLETCMAKKVFFPSDVTTEIPGIKEFALWISLELEKVSAQEKCGRPDGPLYLIESYFEGDTPFMHTFSGYSALMYILDNLRIEKKKFLPLGHDYEKELARRFALNPFEYLEGLNAHVSASRRIECLYRRRATMVDLDIGRRVYFGYPIFIADAK